MRGRREVPRDRGSKRTVKVLAGGRRGASLLVRGALQQVLQPSNVEQHGVQDRDRN